MDGTHLHIEMVKYAKRARRKKENEQLHLMILSPKCNLKYKKSEMKVKLKLH